MHAFTSIDKNGHIVETIPPKCGTFALSMISLITEASAQLMFHVSLFIYYYAHTRKSISKQKRKDRSLRQMVRSRGQHQDHELSGAL